MPFVHCIGASSSAWSTAQPLHGREPGNAAIGGLFFATSGGLITYG
jgi:hypothetical protein